MSETHPKLAAALSLKKSGYGVFVKEAVKALDKLGVDRSYSENPGSLDDGI